MRSNDDAELKIKDIADAKANTETANELDEEIQEVKNTLETLKSMIEALPPAVAMEIATFSRKTPLLPAQQQ